MSDAWQWIIGSAGCLAMGALGGFVVYLHGEWLDRRYAARRRAARKWI